MFFLNKTIKVDHKNVTFIGRELMLLTLLSRGWTPRTIAESAGVPVQTVYSQLRSILLKLRVRTYEKAAKKALRLGLLADYEKRTN